MWIANWDWMLTPAHSSSANEAKTNPVYIPPNAPQINSVPQTDLRSADNARQELNFNKAAQTLLVSKVLSARKRATETQFVFPNMRMRTLRAAIHSRASAVDNYNVATHKA